MSAPPAKKETPAAAPSAKKETASFTDHSNDLASYAASREKQRVTPYQEQHAKAQTQAPITIDYKDPLILNLYVEDQNTAIGRRNIHNLKSGYSLTIGGGKSDFLIFLVPMPSAIGEIRRDSGRCTFIPRKPKYFPELGSKELTDCIGKTIRVVSDKNYELRMKFEQYEDPLEKLNSLLNSLKVPG